MEQYTRHAILDYQTRDMFIEYNLSLECHFQYIIHDLVLFWPASDSYAIIQWGFWHFWTHWETNDIFLSSTILFTLCFNTNLIVLFLPLDVRAWFITYNVYLAPYLSFQYFLQTSLLCLQFYKIIKDVMFWASGGLSLKSWVHC